MPLKAAANLPFLKVRQPALWCKLGPNSSTNTKSKLVQPDALNTILQDVWKVHDV